MNAFFWVVVGLIIGWLIEWMIDWVFWRRDGQQESEARAELSRLKTELGDVRADFSTAQTTIADLRAQLEKAMAAMPVREDRLERVKGIGAVFAGKLKAAGIRTFADLAGLTPEKIHDIIQPEEWQKIEADAWIAEAAKFAEKQAQSGR